MQPVAPTLGSPTLAGRASELADRLGADAAALVGMVAELSERVVLAEDELRGTRALYTSALRKLGQLEQEANTANLRTAEIVALELQLAEALALLDIEQRKSNALMAKLAASPDPATLREAQAMRDAFAAELRDAKVKLAEDKLEKERLMADLDAAVVKLAETEIALEDTALFIDSIEVLPAAAKQLFLELSRLETVNRSELEKNYQMIREKIGARVVDTVNFATGSSKINPTKSANIQSAIASAGENSFFLVVGYASKTGNFDLNKELSSARATAVATLVDEVVKPNQMVRAVFLGQTDRFSTSNVLEDQICELWEVPR